MLLKQREFMLPKLHRSQLPPGESLCDYCTAKCCRYFALPIDTPTTDRDFDFARWYLVHESATLFTEGKTWYLLVYATCRHLRADNRCGIYETRPQICRDYHTDECEYDESWTYERYFELADQLTEYREALEGFKSSTPVRKAKPQTLAVIN